jgi:hypothetical protein
MQAELPPLPPLIFRKTGFAPTLPGAKTTPPRVCPPAKPAGVFAPACGGFIP